MQEYGLNSVLILENTGQRKPLFLHILCSDQRKHHSQKMVKITMITKSTNS